MRDAGLWRTGAARRKAVQQPRARRQYIGELIQIDGQNIIGSMTQYRRALHELRTEILCANTLAAQGRVERAPQSEPVAQRHCPRGNSGAKLDIFCFAIAINRPS